MFIYTFSIRKFLGENHQTKPKTRKVNKQKLKKIGDLEEIRQNALFSVTKAKWTSKNNIKSLHTANVHVGQIF